MAGDFCAVITDYFRNFCGGKTFCNSQGNNSLLIGWKSIKCFCEAGILKNKLASIELLDFIVIKSSVNQLYRNLMKAVLLTLEVIEFSSVSNDFNLGCKTCAKFVIVMLPTYIVFHLTILQKKAAGR